MAVWTGIVDNTGPIKVWRNVDIGSMSRTDNIVYINALQADDWTPSAGAFDNPAWYADVEWPRGTLRIGSYQTKPGTGGGITNNHYFCNQVWFSYGVGAGQTSSEINTRINTDGSWKTWASDQWGSIYIGIPGISGPSLSSQSSSNVKSTSAGIAWSTATGTNCTFNSAYLEYSTDFSYSNVVGIAQSGSTTLTGLQPGKTYNYRFVMYNNAGLNATTGNYTFTTKAIPGAIPILMGLM